MYYHREGYPEESELVLCTVTSVQYNSVFCKLDEYDKTGMIHISEVSPGRIRNIRDYVVEGKKVVCMVLRINEEKGHIDLSLRRVNDNLRRQKNALIKQEQKAEKIIEQLAQDLKEEPRAVYEAISKPILEEYEYVHMAFQEHVDGEADLARLVPKKYVGLLAERVVEKIRPKSVTIEGTLRVSTYQPDGIEVVKDALQQAIDEAKEHVTIRYLGSGAYKVLCTGEDYKEAEGILKQALEKTRTRIEAADGHYEFER